MKIKFNCITLLLLLSLSGIAQVGINTTTPRGALDINTTTTGFVYPVVSLVNTTTETVTNPNAANIIAGTTVYNNASPSGHNELSVYPGIYVWDGSKWVPQFNKREIAYFEQNADVRTQSTGGAVSIPFDDVTGSPASTFTPTYSGNYLVEVKIHYGAGAVDTPGTGSSGLNFNVQEGDFVFTFNGNPKSVDIRSYSADNNYYSAYDNSASQVRFVVTENLTHGIPYPFTLTCDQEDAEGFVGNGNTGTGQGYITINDNVKCTIEFTYIDE